MSRPLTLAKGRRPPCGSSCTLDAKDQLSTVLENLQGLDAAQEIPEHRGFLGRGSARRLRIGDPVQVLEVQAKHGGNGPRGLGEIEQSVQGQSGEQLTRELLVVE